MTNDVTPQPGDTVTIEVWGGGCFTVTSGVVEWVEGENLGLVGDNDNAWPLDMVVGVTPAKQADEPVKWGTPPPPPDRGRTSPKWGAVIEALMQRPGEWAQVATESTPGVTTNLRKHADKLGATVEIVTRKTGNGPRVNIWMRVVMTPSAGGNRRRALPVEQPADAVLSNADLAESLLSLADGQDDAMGQLLAEAARRLGA